MERIIYTYMTTNLVTGKCYIGVHSTDNVDDGYLGSGVAILDAIKSHGKKNFKREILQFHDSLDDAHLSEAEYIKYFNTLVPNGYNISPTGGLVCNGKHSEITKKKISEKNTGRIFTEEHRKKLSLAKKGRRISKTTRKKMSDIHKQRGNNAGEKNGMYGKHPVPWNKGVTKESDSRVKNQFS